MRRFGSSESTSQSVLVIVVPVLWRTRRYENVVPVGARSWLTDSASSIAGAAKDARRTRDASVPRFPFASAKVRDIGTLAFAPSGVLGFTVSARSNGLGPVGQSCQCHEIRLPMIARMPSEVSETYTRTGGRVRLSQASRASPLPALAGTMRVRNVIPDSTVGLAGFAVKVRTGAVTTICGSGRETTGRAFPSRSVATRTTATRST